MPTFTVKCTLARNSKLRMQQLLTQNKNVPPNTPLHQKNSGATNQYPNCCPFCYYSQQSIPGSTHGEQFTSNFAITLKSSQTI